MLKEPMNSVVAKMKFFIVLGLCIVAAQAKPKNSQQIEAECIEESKVSEEAMKEFRKGNFAYEDIPLKKYVLCVMVKNNCMTKDGEFLKEQFLSEIQNREAAEKHVEYCLRDKGNAPYETAWNFLKCELDFSTVNDQENKIKT